MAEEQQGQEKTEEATPRKLEKAKEDGQVARSRELNSVAVVTFGALALAVSMPNLAESIMQLTEDFFKNAADIKQPLTAYLSDAVFAAGVGLLPFSVTLFVAGIVSSVAVGGLILSPKALQPKLNRLSMIKGFGRIFSTKSMVELGKSIAKFILITGVAVAVLSYFLC